MKYLIMISHFVVFKPCFIICNQDFGEPKAAYDKNESTLLVVIYTKAFNSTHLIK
jgi:hypothetical protein